LKPQRAGDLAFEKLGWACDVRWPDEERLATSARPAKAVLGSMTKGAMARRATSRNASSPVKVDKGCGPMLTGRRPNRHDEPVTEIPI